MGLCKTKYLKKHGLEVFLSDFVKTLNNLYNGVQFNINGQNYTVHDMLLAVLADTPAAAFIADMKQSFFAKKFCRNYNINMEDMRNKITINDLEERCPLLYVQRCNDLKTMPERLQPFWSKYWGINGTSPLLQIKNFNISVNMPQDIWHVLLEGLFGHGTCLLLQWCIEEKLFDINWLNSHLYAFPYSYLDRDNKPEKITRNQIFEILSLKQTGASELTMAYILPNFTKEKSEKSDKILQKLYAPCFYCLFVYSTICNNRYSRRITRIGRMLLGRV